MKQPKAMLNFYVLSEQKPVDGQEIMFVHTDGFYNHYELRFGKVEYSWDIVDEDGSFTGSSICYEEGVEQPKDTKLIIIADGSTLSDSCLWAPLDDFWVQVHKHDEEVRQSKEDVQ
jgi:hypothetical protein